MFPTCDSYKCYGVTVLRMREGRKRVGELESSEKVVYLQVESKNADESIMRAKSGEA